VAGADSDAGEKVVEKRPMPDGSWKVKRFTTTFTTDAQRGWFVGVTKLEEKKHGTLVIDNLLIEELGGK
jgi:hypothetical protein